MKEDNALEILIVDDEEIIREILKDFIDFIGHHATCVDNGLDGLKAVEESEYDMAFVDIKMPGMDGIDFLHNLKKTELKSNLPVFIMTGHGSDEIRGQAITAGASGFLCKPFGLTEIQQITDKIINTMDRNQ